MIKLNFYFFIGILEVMLVLIIVVIVQNIYLRKYRPYYLSNTKPELFLRKYLQRLIKQTKKFTKGFSKAAENGDETAITTRQQMTARLNWLILERDFATTIQPNICYWEDINNRIKAMLNEWRETKLIKEPPDIKLIELSVDKDDLDEIDFENLDIDQAAKDQIAALKKRIFAISGYESMYKELEIAYKTLETSYKELKKGINDIKLEAKEAEQLRAVIQQQEANESSLNAMLDEVEKSKDKLNQELSQLEDAYSALEHENMENTNILRSSDNPDAKEILGILNQQESILEDLTKVLGKVKLRPSQKKALDKHTEEFSKTNKEINHCMQMLELERERLADELDQIQKTDEL